jgi:hypothetical protein
LCSSQGALREGRHFSLDSEVKDVVAGGGSNPHDPKVDGF